MVRRYPNAGFNIVEMEDLLVAQMGIMHRLHRRGVCNGKANQRGPSRSLEVTI